MVSKVNCIWEEFWKVFNTEIIIRHYGRPVAYAKNFQLELVEGIFCQLAK
jgi:hypothetical protein